MITLIVARGRDGAIGRDGTMPWQLPEDLAHFRRETVGSAVIMGARTWASLPAGPLPDRFNIIVSSNPELAETVVPDVDSAITLARASGFERIFGIGGARIYRAMLPLAQRLVITEVDLTVPDADTHFPDFDEADWTCQAKITLRHHAPICTVRKLTRH